MGAIWSSIGKGGRNFKWVNQIMSVPIVHNRNVLPFQEGILITNNALVNLYKYVDEKI